MSKKSCMNCSSTDLVPFIDLGEQPNGNVFPSVEEISAEKTYPFVMCVCTNCWQVQLETFPPVQEMFTNHPYLTGINQPVVEHFEALAKRIIHRFNFGSESLVFDIGANDGTLLSKFRDQGLRVLGIDPCENSYEPAKKAGIEIIQDFWNLESAKKMRDQGIFPDLITATAVFYHVEDIHSFVEGLDQVMGPDSVFCTQCVYVKDIIEKLQFDHFYHEHTMIHGIGPLKRLFNQYGFRLLDVELSPIHGGSFLLYVVRNDSTYPTSDTVEKIIEAERLSGLEKSDTYHLFSKRVNEHKVQMVNLLEEISERGQTVYGLGAPLKSSTLLNYCGIGPDLVQCILEVNPLKIGRVTPGTHIPIVHEDDIEQMPDYFLLLTWNFVDYFIDRYQEYLEKGGKFIIPHPQVKVISKDDLNGIHSKSLGSLKTT